MEVIMKKTITTLFLTTAVAVSFAQEQTLNAFAQPKTHFPVDTQEAGRSNTIYLKMAASDSNLPKNDETVMPGLGVGYRIAYGHNAVDISSEWNQRQIRDIENQRTTNYSYTLPKVNYLFYLTPASNNSLYAGAGLALGGVKQTTVISATEETVSEDDVVTPAVAAHNDTREFHGFIPNIAAGYEFNRNGGVKTFVQLDISQPALAVMREGSFFGPKVALSAGLGF